MSNIETIRNYWEVPKSDYYELILTNTEISRMGEWLKRVENYPNPVCVNLAANSRFIPFLLKLGTVNELKFVGSEESLNEYEYDLIPEIRANKVSFVVGDTNIDPHWFGINTPHLSIEVLAYCGDSLMTLLSEMPPNVHPRILEANDEECGLCLETIHKAFPHTQTLKSWRLDTENFPPLIPRLILRMSVDEYVYLVDAEGFESLDLVVWGFDGDEYDGEFDGEVDERIHLVPKCPNYRVQLEGPDVTIRSGDHSTLLDLL